MDTLLLHLLYFGFPTLVAVLTLLWCAPYRGIAASDWVLRSQRYYALQLAAQMSLLSAPALTILLVLLIGPPRWFHWLAPPATGFVCILLSWLVARHIRQQEISLRAYLGTFIGFRLLFGGILLLFSLAVAALMPWEFNTYTWTLGLFWGAVTVLLSKGLLFAILRALGWLASPSPRLEAVIQKAAGQCGVTPKEIYQARSFIANAIALPTRQGLIFTDAIVDILDDAELASVAHHELCHLGMPKWQIRARTYSSGFLSLALVFAKPVAGLIGVIPYLLTFLTLMVCTLLVLRKLATKEEERADAAATLQQEDEQVYARTLEKIYRHSCVPVDLKSQAGHPSLVDRMIAAGLTPDYPRPGRPPLLRFRIAAATHLLLFAILLALYLDL